MTERELLTWVRDQLQETRRVNGVGLASSALRPTAEARHMKLDAAVRIIALEIDKHLSAEEPECCQNCGHIHGS